MKIIFYSVKSNKFLKENTVFYHDYHIYIPIHLLSSHGTALASRSSDAPVCLHFVFLFVSMFQVLICLLFRSGVFVRSRYVAGQFCGSRRKNSMSVLLCFPPMSLNVWQRFQNRVKCTKSWRSYAVIDQFMVLPIFPDEEQRIVSPQLNQNELVLSIFFIDLIVWPSSFLPGLKCISGFLSFAGFVFF